MGETTTANCGPGMAEARGEEGAGFPCRYLAAKKGIDDRAMNHKVWETLVQALAETTAGEPARILEIGAGIGTMVERTAERGLLKGAGLYLATDQAADHIRTARQRLRRFAGARGDGWRWDQEERAAEKGQEVEMALILEQVSAEELAARPASSPPFHLLIAHALLDLVDFTTLLPRLFQRLVPGGLLLLTCNFDGETIFLPPYPGDHEPAIIRRYHASMEARVTGASLCGRRLLAFLQARGLEILAAGPSDWVIHPRGGGYAGDEGFFLHSMVDTVERELAQATPPLGLAAWAGIRRRQIEAGQLTFIARHLDLLARIGGP